MNDIVELLASELASKGKIVEPSTNSVLKLIKDHSVDEVNILVNKVADKISNEIGLYRNVFTPLYIAYKDAVNKILEDKKPENPLHKYKVVAVDIPDYIKELIKKDVIHQNASYVELPISNVVIPVPTDNIRSYFKVSSHTEQMYIDELLSKYSDDDLKNIWEKYLLNVSGSNDNIANLPYSDLNKIDDVALLFALITNLKNNIPDGVSVDESTYTKVMRNFYTTLVADIAILTRTFNDYVKSDRLVIKIFDNTVTVVKPVYNKFLKEQRVEVLLGLMIKGPSGVNSLMLNDILINAQSYLNAWEQKVRLTNISMSIEHKANYRLAYEFAIPLLFKEIPESSKKYISGDIDEISLDVKDYVDELDHSSLVDIDENAAYILCYIIMVESNYYNFLSSMLKYKELDDKLSNKEAASLATLNLIVDYISQQLVVR